MFLTLEDPRAKIQGSRDPLGVQPIWSGFGRQLVCNLTTVSSSVRGFSVLLLGHYLVEQLIDQGDAAENDALPVFLRVEQLCGYARYVVNDDGATLGIDRIRRFLSEGRTVRIEDGPDGWILSNQKSYGLWGLYTVPARTSGLLPDGAVGLTEPARRFVEQEYLPHLAPARDELTRLVLRGGPLKATARNPVLRALADALPPELTLGERAFYGEFLRDAAMAQGQVRPGRQATLAALLEAHTDLHDWIGREEVLALAEASKHEDEGLSRQLSKVARLEAVLAPADCIFGFLLARHDQRPSTIAAEIRERWGRQVPSLDTPIDDLLPEIASFTLPEVCDAIRVVDRALHDGDYEQAIESLFEWNKAVMAARSAAPWVELSSGKLDVRYRGTEGELPSGDDLPLLWRNSYFLDSLKGVTLQVGEAG